MLKAILSRMPKAVAFATVAVAAVVVSSLSLFRANASWGPDRPTYTIEKPADHVTFNSITNNPNYGDERSFFDIRPNVENGTYVDQIKVEDGKEYVLRMYIHNNAADNLNGQNLDGKGVAKNTRVQVTLPKNTDDALRAVGFIMADNASPKSVQDTADFYTDNSKFTVSYVPGSAVEYNNAFPKGMPLSDSIVNPEGALVGYDKADGIFPGCFQYTATVTIKVRVSFVKQPDVTIQKTVRKEGETEWKEQVAAKAGDMLEYRVMVQNSGSTNLTNVTVGDRLPAHISYVPGSTKLYDAVSPNGQSLNDGIANGALRLNATYVPTARSFIVFKAKVDDSINDECGTPRLRNIATVHTTELPADKEDGADVVATSTKKCDTPTEPTYTCDLLSFKVVDRASRKVVFTAKASGANGATFKRFIVDAGSADNETDKLYFTSETSPEFTYPQDRNQFDATLNAEFTVNGETKTVTSDSCKQTVSFATTPTVPTTLPNTGAGSVAGLFAGVSAAGAAAHSVIRRKLARR